MLAPRNQRTQRSDYVPLSAIQSAPPVKALLRFLLAIPAVLLPQRYRRHFEVLDEFDQRRAALFAGVVQMLLFIALWGVGLFLFIDRNAKELAAAMMKANADEMMGSEMFQFAFGAGWFLLYLVRPQSLILLYFILEGFIRWLAALIQGEIVGTLPILIVATVHGWFSKWEDERKLPPLVADRVEEVGREEFQLRIWSCRPRPEWDQLLTISYADKLYEVVRHEFTEGARPFLILLRLKPAHKIVRGLHQYAPDELLQPKAKAVARV